MKDVKTATPEQGPRKRGAGSIYQRGATWWIAYYRRGRQIRESSHSTNRDDAEKLLDRKTKQLWAREARPAGIRTEGREGVCRRAARRTQEDVPAERGPGPVAIRSASETDS